MSRTRESLELTDAKGRTWIVRDHTGTSGFDRVVPLGDPDSCYRSFSWGGMQRWFAHKPQLGEDPADLSRATLMSQLRGSWIPGEKAPTKRADAVAAVYDTRRGMGKR